MRIPNRQIVFPETFTRRFSELFPETENAYSLVHRQLAKGNVDSIASFLLSQNIKFSAQEIYHALQEDGTLSKEFVYEVERRREIAILYEDILKLMPSRS